MVAAVNPGFTRIVLVTSGHRGMGQGHLGAEVSYSPRPEEPDASVYVFTPSRLSLQGFMSVAEGACHCPRVMVGESGLKMR